MIATNEHYRSTTSDYYYDGTDSTTSTMEIPGVRQVVTEVSISICTNSLDNMTAEERFAYWGEVFKELREKIKQLARAAMGLLSAMPEAPYRVVAYYRRICTTICPTQHFKIHNHPVRFVREGL